MLKRIGRVLLLVLQVILICLPFWFHMLYETHLGFMREILFLNENYPIWLIWVVAGVVLFVTVGLLVWAKSRVRTHYDRAELLWLAALGLILIGVGGYFWRTPEFIYDLLLLSLAAFSQLIVVKTHFNGSN